MHQVVIEKQVFSETTYYDNTPETSGIIVNFEAFKEWLVTAFGEGDEAKDAIRAAKTFSDLMATVSEKEDLPAMKEIKSKLVTMVDKSEKWDNPLLLDEPGLTPIFKMIL